MLRLDEILTGDFTLRGTKDREGDLDYFLDNFGKPLVVKVHDRNGVLRR